MAAQLRDCGRRVATRAQETTSKRLKVFGSLNPLSWQIDVIRGRLAVTTVVTSFYRVTLSLATFKRSGRWSPAYGTEAFLD